MLLELSVGVMLNQHLKLVYKEMQVLNLGLKLIIFMVNCCSTVGIGSIFHKV